MIDIHAHILPGMDDGAEDLRDTMEMARMAVESGISVMVATPHCNIPGVYDNYFDQKFKENYHRVCNALEAENLPLQLLLGMEVFATPDLPHLLEEGKLLPINGGRYLLVEFPFEEDLDYVEEILEAVLDAGLLPVIAHAERYECIQDNIFALEKWRDRGVMIQVNKGSLIGRFGKYSHRAAHAMMRRNMVDVIASDCHRPYHRTPEMTEVYRSLERQYSRDYLEKVFHDNPAMICRSQEVMKW